jgi:hypothetical protein
MGSEARESSKHSKPSTPVLPAGEQYRCALLSLSKEIIEITSDDEANLFVPEVVAGPKAKQTTRLKC